MPTKSFLVLFILSSFLVSCKQKENVESNINSYTNAVLLSSQEIIKDKIKINWYRLKEKQYRPQTKDSALVYLPKAESAIALGDNIIDYLNTLKEKVKEQNNLDTKDSLFEKLKDYEVNILKIDSNANQIFDDAILLLDTTSGFKKMNKEQFENQFLKGITTIDYLSFVNSLKANIVYNEAKMVEYFDLSCEFTDGDGFYERYEPMVSQNSKHFKCDETLEITAGVGSFSMAAQPKFTINGSDVEVDDVGVAKYKMKVAKEKGKHIVPVKVSFTKPNGEKQIETHTIVYYVE